MYRKSLTEIDRLFCKLELKTSGERQIDGYGSVFGNVDLGGDVVLPGAFKTSLATHRKSGSMPGMFWMHNPGAPIGVWDEISEDKRGLFVRGTLADTQLGNDTRTLAKMGAVKGLSIGFRLEDAEYDEDGHRVIKQIDLWEVSLVTIPMNPKAQVERVKGAEPSVREIEFVLREMGVSRARAKKALSLFENGNSSPSGMPGDDLRDAGGQVEEALADLLGRFRVASLK